MKPALKTALLFVLILLAACGPTGTPAPTALPTPTSIPTALPGILYVDAGQTLHPVSPYVYGSNYGPWTAVPFSLIDQAPKTGVTILRWPGGHWGDVNDVKEYQIDQLMAFCQTIGAEAAISVRLLNGTPEAAAEMVRYVNVEKGYNVRYWMIGNEPTLFAAELQAEYDTVRFNQEWRTFAQAMLAVDANILLVGPEVHQFTANPDANPKDSSGRDWMTEFLRANGDLADVISFHRYPFPRQQVGPNATVEDLHQNVYEWDETIRYLRGLIRELTGHDIPIAVTEVNSHYTRALSGEATPDSFYNAIWWADVLGRLIRQDVLMVNHWMLSATGGNQGGWGLLAYDGIRPSYYVYQMYQHFGNELVYASSDNPDLSIYAARRADGALTVMLVNLGAESISKPLQLAGFDASACATTTGCQTEVWLFDATHLAEAMPPLAFANGDPLTLAGQSVTLLIFQP